MDEQKYIVSARKYRPSSFESVVGQRALTETLRNAIRSGHLAHAYLFCGPRGVGKTTCARIFAKTINCLTPTPEHDACNACESCIAFNEQRSFNIRELDAASNNSVDDIRSLIDEVRIPPQVGKYKVYIIDEVHMLSQGAFNALLKTLEEPPSYAVFILATTEKHKVLPTILSRCQVFDFARITIADIVAHLQYVAAQEQVEVSEEALNVVAQKADGGMRDALSIFDQLVTFCGGKITYEQTISVLNVLDTEYYFRLVDAALDGRVSDALLLFDEVLSKGFDAGHFVTGFTSHLRNVLVSKDAATAVLLEVSESVRRDYVEQAARCAAPWLFSVLEIMGQCDINYRTARNKRLTVELALVKVCTLVLSVQQTTAPAAPAAPAVQKAPATSVIPKNIVAAPAAPTMQKPAAPAAPKSSAVPTVVQAIPHSVAAPSVPTIPAAVPQPVTHDKQSEQNRPFTLEQLADAWVRMQSLPAFRGNERLLAVLSNIAPSLSAMPVFTVTLRNTYQETELNRHKPLILQFLRQQLQNDGIDFRVEVNETQVGKVVYTPQEKFNIMAQKNPKVVEMAQMFNLQFS